MTERPATEAETQAWLAGHVSIEGAVETTEGLVVPDARPTSTCSQCGKTVRYWLSGWWSTDGESTNYCTDGIHNHNVDEEEGDPPISYLDNVDGHWYVCRYDRTLPQIHATDCRTCEAEHRERVKTWLLAYAWNGTPEQQAAEVDCILDQDGWRHVGAQAEKYRGMAADDEQASEADGFALSALYECHDGPHLPTCPSAK